MTFTPGSDYNDTPNLSVNKIWNPADHWDHCFINWKDKPEGIHTTESLDMVEGDRQYDTIRRQFHLKEYGLTQERT